MASAVISEKVTRRALSGDDLGGLRHVPRDGLALAVEVGREVDHVGQLGLAGDLVHLLLAVLADHVFGREVVFDVDARACSCRGSPGRSRTWP